MGKRTLRWPTTILLVDDNPTTALLIQRLFDYLSFQVIYKTRVEQVEKTAEEAKVNYVLLNLAASCQEQYWITRYAGKGIPVIYYTTTLLIEDFERAKKCFCHDDLNDDWMLNSELFQFFESISIE